MSIINKRQSIRNFNEREVEKEFDTNKVHFNKW